MKFTYFAEHILKNKTTIKARVKSFAGHLITKLLFTNTHKHKPHTFHQYNEV